MGQSSALNPSPCRACTVRATHACGVWLKEADRPTGLQQDHRTARARQIIYRARQQTDHVWVICSGWAFSYATLSDGRRQIFSFMLAGDLISASAVLSDRFSYSVQAITDLRFCLFARAELSALLLADPAAFKTFSEICIAEKDARNELVIDLGRRMAEQRIAHLILRLMARLREKARLHGTTFEFPLRQQHIADATGLTPVHVGRVLGHFRDIGVVELEERHMRVLDLARLTDIANP